jgi:hypothetical protein
MFQTVRIFCTRFGPHEAVLILLAQTLSAYNLYRGWLAYVDPAHVIPAPICTAMVLVNGTSLFATARAVVRWRRAGQAKRILDGDADALIATNV